MKIYNIITHYEQSYNALYVVMVRVKVNLGLAYNYDYTALQADYKL